MKRSTCPCSCNTERMATDALVDPMSELDQLYRQYEEAIELGNKSRADSNSYWAPAPPPLTLAAYAV